MAYYQSFPVASYSERDLSPAGIAAGSLVGAEIVGDEWQGPPAQLDLCDDWDRASYRLRRKFYPTAVNVRLTGQVIRRSGYPSNWGWPGVRIMIQLPGDGEPDQEFPGWLILPDDRFVW